MQPTLAAPAQAPCSLAPLLLLALLPTVSAQVVIGLPQRAPEPAVPLPSGAVEKALFPPAPPAAAVPLPSKAEKQALGPPQPPEGPFIVPGPPPPLSPAEIEAKLEEILQGLSMEIVLEVLLGRGPCTQGTAMCVSRPCISQTICSEGWFCLDDYCGTCRHWCVLEYDLREAVQKIRPGG
ncbi:hypothetical protein ABPG75_000997 [Micractinium tetrahymenae]